jgi:hypothetical protein
MIPALLIETTFSLLQSLNTIKSMQTACSRYIYIYIFIICCAEEKRIIIIFNCIHLIIWFDFSKHRPLVLSNFWLYMFLPQKKKKIPIHSAVHMKPCKFVRVHLMQRKSWQDVCKTIRLKNPSFFQPIVHLEL